MSSMQCSREARLQWSVALACSKEEPWKAKQGER
jgi:hypothetical protein